MSFRRLTDWPLWLALSLLLWLLGPLWLASLQPAPLVLQLSFSPQRFASVLHFWSADELLRYRQLLRLEVLLAGALGLAGWRYWPARMSAGMTRGMPRGLVEAVAGLKPVLLTGVGLHAATALAHLWLTAQPRFGLAWLYAIVASAVLLKWLLLALAGGLLLWSWWRTAAGMSAGTVDGAVDE